MKDLPATNIAQTMSSREIAQLTGKRHDHVLRDCEILNESYTRLSLPKVGESTYLNERGRAYREFLLTKMQTFDLLTGYNTDLRIKVNRRWEELEAAQASQMQALPQNYKEALLALVAKEEEKERLMLENKAKSEQLTAQAPKVAFANAIIASKTSCLIAELAKLITQNGVEIGQNRLFAWMREHGYLGKHGERRNIPNQQYIEQGLFELKKGIRSGNDGVIHTTITPKVTGKGQQYFINKFLSQNQNNA